MKDPFRPELLPDEGLRSPSPDTMGDVLIEEDFPDLYRFVRDEGLPYFVRLNGQGDVELYLVFESIDAFSQATRDAVSIEFKTYRHSLLAIIWTLSDPREPLGFPLTFDIKADEPRFMALRMLEQPEVWIHYLAYTDGLVTHIYSESCTFSETEKEQVKGYIRYLYEAEPDQSANEAGEQDVKEEGISSMDARLLPESVLLESGIGYVLDYSALIAEKGEAGAEELVMSTVQQAVLVMRRHSRSEVRESSFTVWVADAAGKLLLFLTPALSGLFGGSRFSGEEENPFTRFLLALPAFRETVEGSPLQYGAYPIIRYEQGKLYHLELDESIAAILADLAQRSLGMSENPYQHT